MPISGGKDKIQRIHAIILTAAALVILPTLSLAQEPSRQEMEEWFNSPPDKSAAEVNEGELVFLVAQPDIPVHHHRNILVITGQSLASGWVKLTQCHEHLDLVPSTQIVFHESRIRGLKILSSSGIGKSRVEGSSVQLEKVGPDARLCITAESRALARNADGTYSLRNGPYMRKFLDGYYPMRVSMSVRLETSKFHFLSITPASQAGFTVMQAPQEISFDTWFKGRLNTVIRFSIDPKTPS